MNDEMRVIAAKVVKKDWNLVGASELEIAFVAGSTSVFSCDVIVVSYFSILLILSWAELLFAQVTEFGSFVFQLVLVGHNHSLLFEQGLEAVRLLFDDFV